RSSGARPGRLPTRSSGWPASSASTSTISRPVSAPMTGRAPRRLSLEPRRYRRFARSTRRWRSSPADAIPSTAPVRATSSLARSYAERARGLYEELADRGNVGRLLNNLGGLNYTLGNADQAVELLEGAFSVATETGSQVDAGQAMCSLAEVHLGTGDYAAAE